MPRKIYDFYGLESLIAVNRADDKTKTAIKRGEIKLDENGIHILVINKNDDKKIILMIGCGSAVDNRNDEPYDNFYVRKTSVRAYIY